jgi:hypothetical protein
VSIDRAGALFALGCNSETYVQDGQHHLALNDYELLGTRPGYCHHCHTGRCPVGITTQDELLEQRLEPEVGAKRLRNYVKTMNMELTTVARACGKSNVHHLEREDLVALTLEAAAMARLRWRSTGFPAGRAAVTTRHIGRAQTPSGEGRGEAKAAGPRAPAGSLGNKGNGSKPNAKRSLSAIWASPASYA